MISMEAYVLYLMEVEIRISCVELGSGFSWASSPLTNLQLIFHDSSWGFAAGSTDLSALVWEFSTKFQQTLPTNGGVESAECLLCWVLYCFVN